MKKSEFISYLKTIGFEDRIKNLSPYKQIVLDFKEPLQIDGSTEILGLSSYLYEMSADFGNGELILLNDLSESTSVLVFEALESGDWDFYNY